MHYLVISSICNSKSIPILFVKAHVRFKSDGTAVNEFVKFNIITLQYCKTSGKKIRCVCVVYGVTKKDFVYSGTGFHFSFNPFNQDPVKLPGSLSVLKNQLPHK